MASYNQYTVGDFEKYVNADGLLCCPNCQATDLSPVSETDVSGGHSSFDACLGFIFFGPLGLLCGNKKISTKSSTYWLCKKCGNKFRQLQELAAEKESIYKSALGSGVIFAILAVIFSVSLKNPVLFIVFGAISALQFLRFKKIKDEFVRIMGVLGGLGKPAGQ